MRILALDTSSLAASACLWEDDHPAAEFYVNAQLTHSQTILPMTEQLFLCAHRKIEEVDYFAVSTGPGSFTGLRIGLSAVKGMAFVGNKPCVGVSTLEALAYNLQGFRGTALAVMDARCSQVYTAAFSLGEEICRLTPDEAISLEELAQRRKNYPSPVFLVGDGAVLCYNEGKKQGLEGILAPAALRLQRASSVAALAANKIAVGETVSCGELMPQYLRLAQAERERRAREQAGEKK